MKQSDLIVLGLAAVAVYMISKSKGTSSAARVSPSSPLRAASGIGSAVQEVFDAAGQAFANGWRYFTDGTAIDPSGNYYSQGQLVWQNPSNFTV